MKNGAVEDIGYEDSYEVTKSNCVVCCEGKQSRLPFPTGTRATEVLEIVHEHVKGYQVYDPVKNQITISRNVVVMVTAVSAGISTTNETTWCVEDYTYVPESSSWSSSPIQSPEQTLDRPKKVRCKPDMYNQSGLLATADTELTEDLRNPERVQWRKTMEMRRWSCFERMKFLSLLML
ncbi:hypothetical protein EVAR_8816_1 [Eumeta japonica]|uniref:Uncharacterized protein n=1 Tax=Eumeta variegata TaxID=151549 RepID=A0A4C1TU84_EUMVA|nr:hypothetical protein EVAR_8816_1 [Eumeta japonica]